MISNYKKFKEDSILESINESIIYYSPPLRSALGMLKSNKIAIDLLSIETDDIKPDLTFIDMKEEGYFSFITMRNAKKLISEKFPNVSNELDTTKSRFKADMIHSMEGGSNSTNIYSKSRSDIRIGKIINKIFPGKYTSSEVEEFVNSFKAGEENLGEKWDMVSGSDIGKWYSCDNYKDMEGQLGSSCMARKRNIFSIYENNPDVCQMLILTENEKLIGRAIVWTVKSIEKDGSAIDCEYFMDRQYTSKDSDVIKFKNYAKSKGWAYKANNNHHSLESIIFKDDVFDAVIKVNVAKFKGTDFKYDKYPYMDTLRRYNTEDGTLDNSEDEDENTILLDGTSGEFSSNGGGVYSEYHDRYLDEDDAVHSEGLHDWLIADESVYVEYGSYSNRGWWPGDGEYVRYDEWSDFYIHVDDSVYSEEYDYYLYIDNAVSVISEIDEDGSPNEETYYMEVDDKNKINLSEVEDMLWYKKLSEISSNWTIEDPHNGIKKDLLVKDYEDEYIPQIFAIETYPIMKDSDKEELGVDYLKKVDAEVLNIELMYIDGVERTIDQWNYDNEIRDLKDRLIPMLEEELKKAIEKTNELEIIYNKSENVVESLKDFRKSNKRRIVIEERRDELVDEKYK
jgi:hypothetical protein